MKRYGMMKDCLKELIENPRPRVPVVLCLDVSGSMCGAPIQELNKGLEQFLEEMRADELTRDSVELAVVTFSDHVTCVSPFQSVDTTQINPLDGGGCTYMGEGLKQSLTMLERRKAQYQATGVDYYQPILVVMSDGAPNGDPQILKEAEQQLRELCLARRLSVISVGIGAEADMVKMNELCTGRRAVRLHGMQFREFFAWLSQSVSMVSASQPQDNQELDMEALHLLEAEPWPENLL